MQKAKFTEKRFIVTLIFVTSLFLLWGLLHSMSDVLNKHFQNVLNVSKSQSGLIADHDIARAYYLPIICYIVIFLFGYRLYKVKKH